MGRGEAGRVGSRDVKPIHEDISRSYPIYRGRQLGGNAGAIDVDDKGRIARVVQALTDSHGEECGILLHELVSYLLLGSKRLRDG